MMRAVVMKDATLRVQDVLEAGSRLGRGPGRRPRLRHLRHRSALRRPRSGVQRGDERCGRNQLMDLDAPVVFRT